ncbi:MAG TPA: hypothetical protein VFQ30_12065, partial [Ktedonobacteraceae bacterium]|nr:hypothetical protein [Ktedonobacteraceae bacterium]
MRAGVLWFTHEKVLLKLSYVFLSVEKGIRGLALIIQYRNRVDTCYSVTGVIPFLQRDGLSLCPLFAKKEQHPSLTRYGRNQTCGNFFK